MRPDVHARTDDGSAAISVVLWRRCAWTLSALLVIPAFLAPAGAGATYTHMGPAAFIQQRRMLSYPFEQVWPAAIRFLRVDRGYVIEDRDPDAGYILFKFDVGGHEGTGALEMFRTEDASGRPSVQVMINTTAGPSHLPHTLLEGLAVKVRRERGQPAPPPRKEEPKPEPPKKDEPGDGGGPPMMPPPIDPNETR